MFGRLIGLWCLSWLVIAIYGFFEIHYMSTELRYYFAAGWVAVVFGLLLSDLWGKR